MAFGTSHPTNWQTFKVKIEKFAHRLKLIKLEVTPIGQMTFPKGQKFKINSFQGHLYHWPFPELNYIRMIDRNDLWREWSLNIIPVLNVFRKYPSNTYTLLLVKDFYTELVNFMLHLFYLYSQLFANSIILICFCDICIQCIC